MTKSRTDPFSRIVARKFSSGIRVDDLDREGVTQLPSKRLLADRLKIYSRMLAEQEGAEK
jgi:hypothetical protein